MTTEHIDIRADETIRRCNGEIIEVIYKYTESKGNVELKVYEVSVERAKYEQYSMPIGQGKIPFDRFLKVLKPFMMGEYAADEIPEAFRILDADNSGTIDIRELAAYLPVIVPHATPNLLLQNIQKVDKDSDSKLDLAEFTDLLKKGYGRDISIGKVSEEK